ncbi:lanthionine synthetase-like protein [Murinocardiopsis flavida]|uniref:Lanthionine synthetase-like protein n=1 Tax=Murinocardiopsis flavida TaxID=645275 RepID=A0A2P8DG46_9ACTN|nr:lanthionine synthetase C family protein [Murinocardiopsis flavida]PSK96191.1 lanthionine synthetase-like protein [Murinocardiopsis flavida]
MTAGQCLAEGAAGIALLHMETGNTGAVFAMLEQAVAGGVSTAEGAGLYYGAPALSFVLGTCDQPGLAKAKATAAAGTATVTRRRLDAAHRRIDQRHRPSYAEYDLISGLTGLGVVLRRTGDPDLLGDVLTYLVRLTEPLGALPGWWCRHGPGRDRPAAAGGHGNHGIAHGITGPLALLALTHLDGIRVEGHAEAIIRILRWLDDWQRHTGDGAPWWPQTLTTTELDRAESAQPGPLRPSWCYGTPGIARVQQLAGRSLGDTARRRTAENAFSGCVNDPAQRARLIDPGLCHGTAGLLATGRRMAADALTPMAFPSLASLHQRTAPVSDGGPAGLLTGAAGAALAAAGTETSWDACLLLC